MRKQIIAKQNFRCLTPTLTSPKARNLQENIFTNLKLEETQNLLEILSGDVRLKILYLLATQGYLSVSDIAEILKSKASGVSHQLALLRKKGLLKTRKKERIVFYSLADKIPELVRVSLGL